MFTKEIERLSEMLSQSEQSQPTNNNKELIYVNNADN